MAVHLLRDWDFRSLRARMGCAVEKVVNAAVEDALHEAEMLLVARLGAVTLAELERAFDAQAQAGNVTASKTAIVGFPQLASDE